MVSVGVSELGSTKIRFIELGVKVNGAYYRINLLAHILLHPKFLHEVREEIGEALALIFNKSMQTGDVPQEWRDALIVPLFKKGNRSDPCNYRPVSLTSVVCKVMERIVKDNVVEHLNEFNVIK